MTEKMKKCKANDEGIPCEFQVEGGGYCKYHQRIELFRKYNPKMKTHKARKVSMKNLLFALLLCSCQPERSPMWSVQVAWQGCIVESYVTSDTTETVWSKDFKVFVKKIQ